jgi:nitroreductase
MNSGGNEREGKDHRRESYREEINMSEATDERIARDRVSFLRTLRAVRSFRPDPIPREVVHDLLEVARWSGSASNKQPWEILLVRERDTLRSLASLEGYADHLADAPLGIVLVMAGDRAEQETYDEGRLAERIMLAAHAHGVGSSIGWIVGPGRDAARELLGIPKEKVVRTAISLGYPAEEPRRSRAGHGQARKPLGEIIHHERYG